jgi:hypothetical protein
MKPDERRYTPRLKLSIPMKIRNPGSAEEPARLVESSNISARGVSFLSDLPLRVGMPVQVTLTMPEEVAGKPSPEWCCQGRVVHIDSADSPQEKPRIGVELQYYEVNKEQRHGQH